MPKRIQIVIDPDGTIHTNMHGYTGNTCFRELQELVLKAGIELKKGEIQLKQDTQAATKEKVQT